MKEIKSIHEIRNGWLVVVRKGEKYIKIDDVLVSESGRYVRVERYETGLKFIYEEFEWCKDFDIVEIWKPKHKAASLSFDLDDRKIVWKEQEQKYYIAHRWINTDGFGFINWDKENNCMGLSNTLYSGDYDNYQTQFTLLEIEELKEKYNTTLEDFEIIPVKEI